MPFDRAHGVNVVSGDGLLIDLLQPNEITWDKYALVPFSFTLATVDIKIVLLTRDGKWTDFIDLKLNINNSGIFINDMTSDINNLCPFSDICPVAITVQVNTIQDMSALADLKSNDVTINIWSGVYYYTIRNNFISLCDDWYGKQELETDIFSLPSCPPTKARADSINSGFVRQELSTLVAETSYHSQWMNFFHPGAESCYVQSGTRYTRRLLTAIIRIIMCAVYTGLDFYIVTSILGSSFIISHSYPF